MTILTGVANVAMSFVYLCYGTMTLFDLKSGWRDRTRRQFGTAFLAIMFTCGPHHLEHGLHLLLTDTEGGWLDLVAVAVGLPTGVIWFLLRLEAMLGGAGDRSVAGTPRWLAFLPVAGAIYLTSMVALTADLVGAGRFDPIVLPNLAIVVLYLFVGGTLVATQIRNHDVMDRWSLSGLSLAGVFLTCALMHLAYAGYGLTGQYQPDGHILPIDVIAVPGAAYFLWLVVGVHRGQIGTAAARRRALRERLEPAATPSPQAPPRPEAPPSPVGSRR